MAYGTLQTDVLNTSSGIFSTNNAYLGIAKAWVNFNGISTATINNSFNVSSITRNGTGDYTINFTTPMANANYAPVFGFSTSYAVSVQVKAAGSAYAPTLMTTSQLEITSISGGSGIDGYMFAVAVFSN